jgi:hypothetical protein
MEVKALRGESSASWRDWASSVPLARNNSPSSSTRPPIDALLE